MQSCQGCKLVDSNYITTFFGQSPMYDLRLNEVLGSLYHAKIL